MDSLIQELERWIDRAESRRAHLPAGSEQERHWARAIRWMKLAQVRHDINRGRKYLMRLPPGSEECRELARALDQMDEELFLERREILSSDDEADTDDRSMADVREALANASFLPVQPTAQARLRAIAETERALARLREYQGRTLQSDNPSTQSLPRHE